MAEHHQAYWNHDISYNANFEPAMMLFLLPLLFALPSGWKLVSNKDGIETAQKTIPNSALFAFRGETITDVPVATLASLILDDPKGVDCIY